MEKLQQALAKARLQRDGAAPKIAAGQAARTPNATETNWAELTGFTPSPALMEKERFVTAAPGPNAAAFDMLRTKIMLMMRKNGWRRLGITSPTAACGKTTTACNLALGMSRAPDLRAILMEFDLRRPTIGRRLQLTDRPGIRDLLTGEATFQEQARRFRDNVAICAATDVVNDPSAILLSNAAHRTLAQIEQAYAPDLMIFDIPPLLISEDSQGLLKDIDCVLIVARAEHSTVEQIDACERAAAEQNNVLGVVLNQCRHIDETGSQQAYDS